MPIDCRRRWRAATSIPRIKPLFRPAPWMGLGCTDAALEVFRADDGDFRIAGGLPDTAFAVGSAGGDTCRAGPVPTACDLA